METLQFLTVCKIRRTVLLELSEIATCFVFGISRVLYCLKPFVFRLTVALFYHTYFVHLSFIISVELSHSSCLTAAQGHCNVSPSFRGKDSTLLFPFESLMAHSCDYAVRTDIFFDNF